MQKTAEYQALLYAFKQDGCSICRLTHAYVHRYLETWKYELFTDGDVRQQLRRSQGFCHAHTRELVKMGANLQLAQAYRDIITDEIEQLQQRAGDATPGGKFLRRIFEARRTPAGCLACQQQEKTEDRYLDSLRKALLDEHFYQQFATSQGLCLPHFRLASAIPAGNTPDAWLSLLRKAQLSCLQRLEEQLSEMIRKHDYRFKDEEHGPEMLSWKRAAGIVSGEE
ncbi:MAG TPA: DUF6062 family protein [Ktedonosporobacter sp.]|nr:DUF6062 family protein [Ktedonosporobacter sp.]